MIMNENQNVDVTNGISSQANLDQQQTDQLEAITEHLMSLETTIQHENIGDESRFRHYFDVAKFAGLSAIVAAGVSPANELSRLSVFGLAEAYSRTPLAGGLAAGLSTFAIESISGLATATVLGHPKSEGVINKINEKGKKAHVPMDHELSVGAKTFWTFIGGTPVGMLLEQREDPTRTVEKNRRYSLITSSWQAGVLAVGGALASEGINIGLEDPKRGVLIAGGLAAVATAGNWMRKKGKNVIDKFKEKKLQEEFEGYSKLTKEYGRESPQHQGMNFIEYSNARNDKRVVSTDVEVDGKNIKFPQLSPVEMYSWLNDAFYAKKFTAEHESGNLLHMTDIPGVEPSMEVKQRLQELAANDGVLVFDFPSSDPDFTTRISAYLDNLGIEASEPELLGTQTYFAGQASLIRERDLSAPLVGYMGAYEKIIEDGEISPEEMANGATVKKNIGIEEARSMRTFYDAAYQVLNDHPCNQGLDPDQFYDMITEQDEVAKIVNCVDGEVTALLLLSDNLDELDWVNAEYYREHFPDKAAKKQIVWFPGLAADPEKTRGRNLQAMANLLCRIAEKGNNEVLVVFDACDVNTGFLDVALNGLVNRSPQMRIDIQPFADQKYYAVKTSLKQ